jgi:hypothetical protein
MPLVGIGTPPQPPTRRLVCPLPPVSGGRGTLAFEKGVGKVPIPTRGIHCGTLYMYVLCVFFSQGSRTFCTYFLLAIFSGGGMEHSSLYDSKKKSFEYSLDFLFNLHFQCMKDTFYPLLLLLSYYSVLLWWGSGGCGGGGG